MKTFLKIELLIIILFMLSAEGLFAQQNTRLTSSVFSMGFARPTSDNNAVTSIIGQPLVATSTSEDTRLESGFLSNTFFSSPEFFIQIIIDDTLTVGEDSELTLSNPSGFSHLCRSS